MKKRTTIAVDTEQILQHGETHKTLFATAAQQTNYIQKEGKESDKRGELKRG